MDSEAVRRRIEDFIRRYWYESNRVIRVLAMAVAILLVILLAIQAIRWFRVLAASVLIGTILVVGWLLVGSSLTIPRFSTTGPVVRNGVAVIVACGKKQGIKTMGPMDYAPEPRTGTWAYRRKGDCTIWYHNPPDASQREARQLRARAHLEGGSLVPERSWRLLSHQN